MIKDLERHGFEAERVGTGAEATAAADDFDVVLIDLDLTDFDGLTLCKRIREASHVPMIGFASVDELDRVLALEGGCDDCVTKPYPSRELMARLGALLRRVRSRTQPLLVAGQLEIDPNLREVRVDGRLIELTRKEYEIIHLLAAERGKIFSRSELLRRVWGYDNTDTGVTSLASRTIDTHLSSIRKKLGSSQWIVTVRGIGFRFSDETVPGEPNAVRHRARSQGERV
ncbi:response regulator transcription factor [Streptomyces albus subsp. chlorinus]|uniref:response regulator transcription factor n=1 Tax=Streptomyces albus TaxID=1888 RepID=UPI00156FCA3D|nr:response regulator transcription factor [Streptomyces albus]NSC25599.1 response regulator transcription factor [Streptomyces albus subsp. chlorinus]